MRPSQGHGDRRGEALHRSVFGGGWQVNHFMQYMQHNRDDSPLYVFDPDFADEDETTTALRNDYEVPR